MEMLAVQVNLCSSESIYLILILYIYIYIYIFVFFILSCVLGARKETISFVTSVRLSVRVENLDFSKTDF